MKPSFSKDLEKGSLALDIGKRSDWTTNPQGRNLKSDCPNPKLEGNLITETRNQKSEIRSLTPADRGESSHKRKSQTT